MTLPCEDVRVAALFIFIPPSAFGAFVEVNVHVMSGRPLRSVRHRSSRPPSYVLCTKLHFQLPPHLGTGASFQGQEPRPSLEDSNHSGLDLMSASIGKPDPASMKSRSQYRSTFRFLNTGMWGGTWRVAADHVIGKCHEK